MRTDKDTKQLKKNALMSFLEASTTPNPTHDVSKVSESKVSEDQEEAFQQYVEELSNCNVCGVDLEPQKRKKCQFCNMPACNDHMRKRRKKKGKWQRICDSCEDKYIYDVYMKLQSKADESLGIQQQITTLKHENFLKELQDRKQKRRQIGFKTMNIKQHYQSQMIKTTDAQNRLMSLQHQVESAELSVNQLQAFVDRAQASFKENNQESWNILSEQNTRMAKELTKLQKKVIQINLSIEGKQKQIESAFEAWQQRQFKKKLQNQGRSAPRKKDNCQIF